MFMTFYIKAKSEHTLWLGFLRGIFTSMLNVWVMWESKWKDLFPCWSGEADCKCILQSGNDGKTEGERARSSTVWWGTGKCKSLACYNESTCGFLQRHIRRLACHTGSYRRNQGKLLEILTVENLEIFKFWNLVKQNV